jgi:hypothetical protein
MEMNKRINNTYYNELRNLKLDICEDDFEAYLTIFQSGKPINESAILNLLDLAAIHEDFYVQDSIKEKEYNKPFLIAKGVKSLPDMKLRFFADTNTWISDNYQIQKLSEYAHVKKGDAIAKFAMTKSDEHWIDIHGAKRIPHFPELKEYEKRLGQHVYWDADTSEIKAKFDGYPFIDPLNQISLMKEIRISSEIKNQKIICFCDLNLEKDVIHSTIIAAGDIFLLGTAENCNLFSNHNISLKHAEKSIIIAWNNLTLQGKLKSCKTFINKHLLGNGKSMLEGGFTSCGESIITAKAGSEDGSRTEIELSYLPGLKILLTNYFKEFVNEILFFFEIDKNQLRTNFMEQIIEFIKQKNRHETIKIFHLVYPNVALRVLEHLVEIKKEEHSFSMTRNLN